MKVILLNLIVGSPYGNIYKTIVENCFKVSFSSPSSYYHFFGIAIFSSRNRVFFRTFLYFKSIHKISVRHSKILYISGIRQRNILSFTSFCLSRCPLFHSKCIFSKKYFFFVVLSPLQRDKSSFVLLP